MFPKGRMHCCQHIHPHPQKMTLYRHSKEEDAINDDELQEENETKLLEYHAKNYFNSMMGGKDVQVLFAMAIGCNTRNLPSNKDPPFSKSKVYHTKIKRDAIWAKYNYEIMSEVNICNAWKHGQYSWFPNKLRED